MSLSIPLIRMLITGINDNKELCLFFLKHKVKCPTDIADEMDSISDSISYWQFSEKNA